MEIVIIPEMETAGKEALAESRAKGLSDLDTVVNVYAAMRAVWVMSVMPRTEENVH